MADLAIEDVEGFVELLIGLGSQTELQRSRLVDESGDEARVVRELAALWAAPNLRIVETRINGARVDVRMQSDDGRAWLAVLWVHSDRVALVDARIYERPPEFHGAGAGMVIVLNGPSSVGKSATMAAFADAAATPWACVDEPMFGRLAPNYLAHLERAGPVADGFLAALGSAARVGNQLIVSAGGIEQQRFRQALVGVPIVYVGLQAPLDVLLQRQRTQRDKFGGLAEESVGIHDGWVYDLEIDTAARRPELVAQVILEFLDSSATSRL